MPQRGRRVEQAVLQELVNHARKFGIARIVGTYRPTERNRLVADHYAKLGFSECACPAKGSSLWSPEVANHKGITLPMKIVRSPA
jgi:predicted enzyme involved in methoxymalonyl-ACP biosynthesis